ncbi:MAG TPA: DUF4402 domain-containing protein, partial [Sphingorhabdus sp.]|nr:DUF4402 domain-containing protein [Sphingorhabdus sp.]
GTVTLATDDTRSGTGGIVLLGAGGRSAKFAGMGTQNQQVTIGVTSSSITLTGPGTPMVVDNFSIDPEATLLQVSSTNYQILPADGIFWFRVGGRLNVGPNQIPGAYSGSFDATLEYQ